jgi:uncharacterized protein (UPF0210 family)
LTPFMSMNPLVKDHPVLADKALCRLRTITTFVVLERDPSSWKDTILRAAKFCGDLSGRFQRQGYQVQTMRIVTNPFGEYLDTRSIETARRGLNIIGEMLNSPDMPDLRIRFAVGEARTAQEISVLPTLIKEFGDLCNACVNVEPDTSGILDNQLIRNAAEAVSEISRITPRGEGNFNFTVNFNCSPLIPYFPAGYHRKELGECFVIGMETPDLLVRTLQAVMQDQGKTDHNASYRKAYRALKEALQYHVTELASIAESFQHEHGFTFSGVDSSAAPSKNCSSMVDLYRLLGVEYFGASGTVEASSLLTRVFQSVTGVDLVGFSGLMLAVTEDQGLAEATRYGHFDIRSLLTYSAVCGIGLDTVPIPGDTSIGKISALMRDTGTMAYRLNKPLTVRLFPVPGLKAGDMTAFESDDLCNCAVLAVP